MATVLVVPVVEVKNLRPHPNADRLELIDILGYQMVVPKDKWAEGQMSVYFPADTLLQDEWAEKFGVKKLLRGKNKDRVGRIKLRGEPSFGLIVPLPEGMDWKLGDNVAEYFGAEKYEPPIKTTAGDAAAHDSEIDPFFQRYTDIENGRLWTEIFVDGEEVVATEKIHGSNCKVGLVNGVEVAGSMGVRRKRPQMDGEDLALDDPEIAKSTYWFPWSLEGVRNFMLDRCTDHKVVLVYGEVYGSSIQFLKYGLPNAMGFAAFDIYIDGKYLAPDEFGEICDRYNIPRAPVLYRGPFDMTKIKELADGKSTFADHMREGVVVKPVLERIHPKIGRVVLKFIGTEYELKQKGDSKDV